MSLKTDLRHVIYALSDALDLVGIDDVGHGKRVGIMAAECAKVSGASASEVIQFFDLGMLHDIGVSSTQTHRHLVTEFDWDGSQEHCEIGYTLLHDFAPLAHLALPVKYHHTRWEKLQPMAIPPAIARQANLILLVDRVDAMAAPHYTDNTILSQAEAIREQVRMRTGSYFAPELVEIFLKASRTEAFWLMQEPSSIQLYLQDILAHTPPYPASLTELRQLAHIFSRIVDAKSPFTGTHSQGVAGLSLLLAKKLGIPKANCDKIEIAGLLHDLGKLRVPDEILDKPARLDTQERLIINTHAFWTFQILRNIEGFGELTQWAAYHHEEPGGHGYPFRLDGTILPLEARIIRVADIFQAMVQDRPYRKGLNEAQALEFIEQLAQEGRVDAEVVATLASYADEAMRAARASQPV